MALKNVHVSRRPAVLLRRIILEFFSNVSIEENIEKTNHAEAIVLTRRSRVVFTLVVHKLDT